TQTLSTVGREVIARCRRLSAAGKSQARRPAGITSQCPCSREFRPGICGIRQLSLDAFLMITIKNTLLAVASSATAFSVWAQDSAAINNNGDNLVVSANRFSQPVSSVLAPTSVVTRNDIERWQAKSLTDVMRRLPGVDVAQNGGMGQNSSLFIRGTNS